MNYEYEGGISEERICKNGWQSALGGPKTLLFISRITLLLYLALSFGYTNGLISVTNWIY